MARNRQRAKQRQAERRAARLSDPAGPADGRPASTGSDPRSIGPADDPATEAQLAAAAPPETAGRSDTVVESPPPAPDPSVEEGVEELGPEPATPDSGVDDGGDGAEAVAERDVAGAPRADVGGRGKVVAFLQAVVAELKRVQWPNRAQLTSLTGVVLGFVLVAGGYLGLLDAIVSRVIQAIL